jgi:hypothetical protein
MGREIGRASQGVSHSTISWDIRRYTGLHSAAHKETEKGRQMMLARWQFQARFGHKNEAIALLKEWNEQIGAQTDIDVSKSRILTGSVGASEALVESEIEIAGLDELQKFFDKIASISMHQDWGKQMSEVVVSGSTRWEVFRIV